MSLSEIELRVLGALLEKERTTPEAYPLSTNAVVAACNQRTNREPVTDYTLPEVDEALRALGDKGLVESGRSEHERVTKHRHRLAEALAISPPDFAVLAVLMLRGPQTPGELRTRTERYAHVPARFEVEESLARLEQHRPPLARNHGRAPGQSQDRWGQALGPDPERRRPRARPAGGAGAAGRTELAELQREVAWLREQVERLLEHAGLVGTGRGG